MNQGKQVSTFDKQRLPYKAPTLVAFGVLTEITQAGPKGSKEASAGTGITKMV